MSKRIIEKLEKYKSLRKLIEQYDDKPSGIILITEKKINKINKIYYLTNVLAC